MALAVPAKWRVTCECGAQSMTPALHNLIKFLAHVAVDQYLDELRQSKKLPPNDGRRPACLLPEQEHEPTKHQENEGKEK